MPGKFDFGSLGNKLFITHPRCRQEGYFPSGGCPFDRLAGHTVHFGARSTTLGGTGPLLPPSPPTALSGQPCPVGRLPWWHIEPGGGCTQPSASMSHREGGGGLDGRAEAQGWSRSASPAAWSAQWLQRAHRRAGATGYRVPPIQSHNVVTQPFVWRCSPMGHSLAERKAAKPAGVSQ